MLFNPTDANGSVANAQKAKAADVPVFCIDREINSTNAATAQMLSDSYSGCVALGQYFVKVVGKDGKYAELLGIVGDNNTWNRSKGFHRVLDRFPGLKMVAQQSADFDRAKGLEVFESILQKNPDIAATGMQFPKVMAQKAAEFADEYIKGKRDFQQKIPVKVELVTPENVSKFRDYGKKN